MAKSLNIISSQKRLKDFCTKHSQTFIYTHIFYKVTHLILSFFLSQTDASRHTPYPLLKISPSLTYTWLGGDEGKLLNFIGKRRVVVGGIK